jgi:hypothetical protein
LNAALQTDERLRTWLNGNQPSRERMCLAVLARDRNYSDIHPRRPEGGPDGGRDIQAIRNSELCFGAVGFLNNVSDSPQDKREIKKKFHDDVNAAINANMKPKAFVFLTNVDLTPGEIEEIRGWAITQGLSFVDIYWRERIRQVLDSPEGLAIRHQYLGINMSEAEQASFFSRFGNDLERLVQDRFDSIDRKMDALEFAHWKNGTIRKLSLELQLRQYEETRREGREHFRVFLELQSVCHEKRSIILGGRDEYWLFEGRGWYFGSKTFFWRQMFPPSESVWIPQSGIHSTGGGRFSSIDLSIKWFPRSPILVEEFRSLGFQLLLTENLIDRLASVKLAIDSYVFVNENLDEAIWVKGKPCFDWPEALTAEEEAIEWRRLEKPSVIIALGPTPPKQDYGEWL